MSDYYPRILKILQEKNISQRKFAQILNEPRATVNNWLLGIYEPPLEVIEKTAKLLEISIDQIIFERDKNYWKE